MAHATSAVEWWVERATKSIESGKLELERHSWTLLRFEVDLLVAFPPLDEDLQTLGFWIARAARGSIIAVARRNYATLVHC